MMIPEAEIITIVRKTENDPMKTIASATNPEKPGRPSEAKNATVMKKV